MKGTEVSDSDDSHGSVIWSYILRGLVGLLGGVVVGALLGALLLILLVGPVTYVHYLNDNRPAGIISGDGTEAGFTLAVTVVFAFWGAVVCGPLGFSVGLYTALVKLLARAKRLRSNG